MWTLKREINGIPAGTEIEMVSGSCGSYRVMPLGLPPEKSKLIRVSVDDINVVADVNLDPLADPALNPETDR